jgi:hypothetical protein
LDECEANKRKNDMAIVELKRFLNGKSFLLTDPKDKDPISDISINFNLKNGCSSFSTTLFILRCKVLLFEEING